ncbi:Hypothetical protein NocV09_02601000 [Nannochloropsis oceanica]
MTPEEAAAAAAAAAAEEAAKAAGAGSGAPPGMEEAAEAVVKSSLSFAVVIIILLVCAGLAAALVYLQRKRHETSSLLSGLDNRYDDILDRLQEIGDQFDDTMEKAEEEPSTLEKRNALIKRAAAVIPIVRVVQQEMQQKQGAIDEETEVIRQIAEEINPGFGQRIFSMVASSQHFQLLFMMDSNSKAYETALAENPDKAEQKLLLIIHRAMPCFDFLKQMKGIPIEALHKDGKISLDEYECFMGVKHRLEEEKKAVEAEAVRIDPDFKVFHMVMGPQQQLSKSEKKEEATPPAAPAAAGAPAVVAAGGGGKEGGKAVKDDLAAKVAEAERIAAELMAEESSSHNKKGSTGGGGGGGKEGGKEGGPGGSGSGKKKKTPKA